MSGNDFADLPAVAAWQHEGARDGFEVVRFDGCTARGTTTAVEDGVAFTVTYRITWDELWRAVEAQVHDGDTGVFLEHDGRGAWRVDGVAAPHLDGCYDVDLESSALTNTFPVHRLALEPGQLADTPAAYVAVDGLRVERLEQTYARVEDGAAGARFDYRAPVFEFGARLTYDQSGLVLDYPGLASRARVG